MKFLLVLLAALPVTADSPEDAMRAFLRTLYLGDAAAYEKTIVPHPRAKDLLSAKELTKEERAEILADVAAAEFQPAGPYLHEGEVPQGDSVPDGTIGRFTTGFRGSLLVIPIVRQKGAWKVDVRWWLAMREMMERETVDRASEEFAVKSLLFALLRRDRETARKYVVAGGKVETLLEGAAEAAELEDQYFALAAEMPLVRAAVGEWVRLPGGPHRVAAGETFITGQYGAYVVTFELKKAAGGWRVVPHPYLQMMELAR